MENIRKKGGEPQALGVNGHAAMLADQTAGPPAVHRRPDRWHAWSARHALPIVQPAHPPPMLQNPLVPPALSTRSRRSVVRGAAGAVGLLLLGNWRLASGAGEAATEAHLPQVAPVPGGIVRVSLGPSQERPRAWAGEVPLLVLGDPIEWSALVGIPLSAAPGEARIVVQGEAREPRELAYTVTPKRYAEQRLKVAPKTVDLSPEDLARFERERDHQKTVMATFSEPAPGDLRMRVPVAGRRSSSFGLRRVFNGQARSPHSGMDIAAPTGTPVEIGRAHV